MLEKLLQILQYTLVLVIVTILYNACSSNSASGGGGGGTTSGSNGFSVTDGNGVALGLLVNSEASPQAGSGVRIWNATEGVFAAYIGPGGGGDQHMYLPTAMVVQFAGANCTGQAYIDSVYGVRIVNEIIAQGANYYKVTNSAVVAGTVAQSNFTNGSCGAGNPGSTWLLPVTATTTSLPLTIVPPLQFTAN